jgi:fructosamine-3-kinase
VGATAVGGGDTHDAYRATLGDGRVVFVKAHDAAPPDLFAAEADGLAWLGDAIRVPRVIAAGASWLALEWLELAGRPDDAAFGRALARLHARGAPGFGYARANYLATLPQDNTPAPDAIAFYVERRLRPLARRAGLPLDAALDRLRARPDRFGPPEPPARLHGDLWWGNVAALAGTRDPVVFDPAVYGGPRELDLAMLALFGELPDALVAAYAELAPLAPGFRDRLALWQLSPLLAHACLFGGGYGSRAAAILRALT